MCMSTLNILEEKIKLLIVHVQKLQSEKSALQSEKEALGSLNSELKAENAQLTQENVRLQEKAKEAHISHTKESKQLGSLTKERELTKSAVDELIKSIDVFVSSEAQ